MRTDGGDEVKPKQLTEHQALNLALIVKAYQEGRVITPNELNMSALSALMRRGIVRVVPTVDARAIVIEQSRGE